MIKVQNRTLLSFSLNYKFQTVIEWKTNVGPTYKRKWIKVNTQVAGYKNLVCRSMVFNATFNNMSIILWQSVLLVEETGVPGENHRPVANH